jgi:hypothetical protein
MEAIYNTPAAAAKQIRIELKAAFPGIKFSVRTETYSMGNSINISWTNGPTQTAVNLIVKKYEYGRFDGMTDSSSVEDTLMSMPDGTVARLGGAKHVFTRREISEDIKARAERDVCALNSVEYKGANTPVMGENGYSRWNAGELSRSIIYSRDLTKGYNGMRLLPQTEDRIGFEDCVEIIPEGEVAAPAPVDPVSHVLPVEPVSVMVYAETFGPAAKPAVSCALCGRNTREPVQIEGVANFYDYCPPCAERRAASKQSKNAEIAPVVLETHIAAALEIITHVGTPIRTMSAPARRATVAHRCYVRYPSLDRELVMRAVLTVLVCEMTGLGK